MEQTQVRRFDCRHRTARGHVAGFSILAQGGDEPWSASAYCGTGKSIAVLPFENRSADKENAFFADGVQDEILTDLAKVADLKVISRTSVMSYRGAVAQRNLPDIARSLGVANILERSVQRAAGRVRVTAQLIDARTDTHLWAEKYDRDLVDVFAIQSDIAQAIVTQLRAKLSPQEKAAMKEPSTSDLAAYDLYLGAKELQERSASNVGSRGNSNLKAVKLLEQATARDPGFVRAWCLLARTRVHAALGLLHAGLGEKEDALMEANRAIELEGDDRYFIPSAQEILARIEVQVGDPAHALDQLPGILDAHYFSWVTGVPLTRALLRLDPIWDPTAATRASRKSWPPSRRNN